MEDVQQQVKRLEAGLKSLERGMAELKDRLKKEATGNAPPASELGRRRAERKKRLLRADYATDEAAFSDIATDISEGGARIESSRRQEVGTVLNLVLDMPQAGRPLKMQGQIVRISEEGEGKEPTHFALGIRFLPMDTWTQQQLHQFVASLPGEATPGKKPFNEQDKAAWLVKIKQEGL